MVAKRMTTEELARIKRKLAAISPGPWFPTGDIRDEDDGYHDLGQIIDGNAELVCQFGFESDDRTQAGRAPSKEDLGFICDAPEIVVRLLDEIEALRRKVEEFTEFGMLR